MGKQSEPLTESYFYILMCLYAGPNHGYGIMRMADRLSGGNVKIGSGTMYGATSNMLKKGWIAEYNDNQQGSERRRMYSLTESGKQAFLDEYKRISKLTESAKEIIEHPERFCQIADDTGNIITAATEHTLS